MAIVVRVRGYTYDGDGEHCSWCYLCPDGSASLKRYQAREYDNEADAWEHLWASDADDEGYVEVE